MHFLNRIEFYITNTCNLNCTNCNRFNNFAVNGHQKWANYQDDYRAWSKIINFNSMAIIGGEPMSNPDLPNWINGITELWPTVKKIPIVTNGTYLNKVVGFYDLLKKHNGKVFVEVSGHNASNILQDIKNIEDFFPTTPNKKLIIDQSRWETIYRNSRQPGWPDCDTPDDFYNLPENIQKECIEIHVIHPLQIFDSIYTDGIVTVFFFPIFYFYSSAVIHSIENGSLTLHNSDPVAAVNNCYFKTCPHFMKGKLYKCAPTGLLPDFIDQFQVDISDCDRELIKSYQPAKADWPYEKLESFLNNQKNADAIDQCKFCPEKLETGMPLNASNKKIKIALSKI